MCIAAAPLAIGSMVLTAVSTVAQIQAQRAQATALRQQGEFEAAIARNNQVIAERAAEDAIQRGKVAEGLKRTQVSQLIGIQRAALAGGGIEVDEGSALDVTTDTAGIGEFEAQVVRANAEREAFDLRTRAMNFAGQAQLALLRSRTVDTSFATALSGASTILGNFALFRRRGVFGSGGGGGGVAGQLQPLNRIL